MPDNRHSNPPAKEAPREDPISVQWQRPQDQGCNNIDDEEDGSDAQPLADVSYSLGRHGVDDVV